MLLTELFPPTIGGSAALFHEVYARVDSAGIVVLTDGVGPADGEQQGRLRIFRYPLATSRWGVSAPAALLHHLRVALRVRKLASRNAIAHCARALPEGVAALLARLLLGPRYVCWAHGEDLITARSSREFTFLTQCVYRWSDAALANSRNTAHILEQLGVPAEKIHVIFPGVDAGRFHPAVPADRIRARFAGPGDILLLSVGRLQRRKGHDIAIEAMGRLRNELPRLRYVIVGDGPERDRLQHMIEAHDLVDCVFLAGAVAESELPAFYVACDIFLLPNRVDDGDIEGFGIVFLEAAAAGRVVIGGNSGGVPEAVAHDVTGLLVDGADVAAVALAIRQLAAAPERRVEMGLAGRRRVLREFSWERAAGLVSELQRRLTETAQKPS